MYSAINQRWGEFPVAPSNDSGIAALERETIIKPRLMNVESRKLYQPKDVDFDLSCKIKAEKVESQKLFGPASLDLENEISSKECTSLKSEFSYDPRVMHSIEISNQKTVGLKVEKGSFDFGSISGEVTEISTETCRDLLRQSILILLAHAGYQTASESAVDLLHDMADAFLKQITTLISDEYCSNSLTGENCSEHILTIISKVFSKTGVGSVKSLKQYYQQDIIKRHEFLQQKMLQCSSANSQRDSSKIESGVKAESNVNSWLPEKGSLVADTSNIFEGNVDAPKLGDNEDLMANSIKTFFESESHNGHQVGAVANNDSGYDLVASTLINIASPNTSQPKKKNKK